MRSRFQIALFIPLAAGLVVLAGCGSVSVQLETPAAQTTGSISADETASPAPGSTPSEQGNLPLPAQRTAIVFAAGASYAVVTTQLGNGKPQAYQLRMNAGQNLYITQSGRARLQLYGPQDQAVSEATNAAGPWKVMAPAGGEYTLIVDGSGELTFSVYVPAGTGAQTPAPIPSSLERISFSSGATSASLQTDLAQGTPYGYVMTVQAHQSIQTSLTGNATLALLDPQGMAMKAVISTPGQWQFDPTQASGDYDLILLGTGPVRLTVTIPPPSASAGTLSVTPAQNHKTANLREVKAL